jgi:hypothetical protein
MNGGRIGGSGSAGGGIGGIERERSRLDLARQHSEAAAKAYRRARLAAERGVPAHLRASRAELVRQRAALAAELERVGGLACPTLEAAASLAVTFRAACEALERTDLLGRGGGGRYRSR